MEEGWAREDALREAARAFGDVERIREELRATERRARPGAWVMALLDGLVGHVRLAARTFRRKPGFTAVIVLTLALGIGANTAIFSVVYAVLLRPPPFGDPDRLVIVQESLLPRVPRVSVSASNFLEWQRRSTVFEGLALHRVATDILTEADSSEAGTHVGTGREEPLAVPTARVRANLFTVLGVAPLLGRPFRPEEEERGNDDVVILSHGFWQRRFGGGTEVIGQQIALGDRSRTIVGVMPSGFMFPPQVERGEGVEVPVVDAWVPLTLRSSYPENRSARSFPYATGRLRPGTTVEQAQQQLDAIAEELAEEYPRNQGWGVHVESMTDFTVGEARPMLLLLIGAVGLVLLIASTNVAAMLLSRAIERQREMITRAALGASRSRLIRQLLTEGLILGLAGAAAGLLAAYWGVRVLPAFAPVQLPQMAQLSIDGHALGYALGVTLLSVVIFSLVPALQLSNSGSAAAQHATGGARIGGERSIRMMGLRVRPIGILVIAQVAISVPVLVAAGLLIGSFARLQRVDSGFEAANLLIADIGLPNSRYPGEADRMAFFQQLIEETSGLPGVHSVAAARTLPFHGTGASNGGLPIDGVAPGQPQRTGIVTRTAVTPGYFQTMRIPLLRSRVLGKRPARRVGGGVVDRRISGSGYQRDVGVARLPW